MDIVGDPCLYREEETLHRGALGHTEAIVLPTAPEHVHVGPG